MSGSRKTKVVKIIGSIINIGVTLGSLVGVFYVGASLFSLGVFAVSAYVCMITHELGYHRYFSHKSFKTGRAFQFVLGVLTTLAPVRGPIWWAANHRDHHKHTDTLADPHTPLQGPWTSYMGWVYQDKNIERKLDNVKDLVQFKELRILDRLFWLPMLLSFIALYFLGEYLAKTQPQLETSGAQLLVWGGFMRVLYPIHVMALLNTIGHSGTKKIFGYRNFDSPDASRNLWLFALLGAGVGWHNNHHKNGRYASTRVMWWELDVTGAVIALLEKLKIVWDVKWIPESYRQEALAHRRAQWGGECTETEDDLTHSADDRKVIELVKVVEQDDKIDKLGA